MIPTIIDDDEPDVIGKYNLFSDCVNEIFLLINLFVDKKTFFLIERVKIIG